MKPMHLARTITDCVLIWQHFAHTDLCSGNGDREIYIEFYVVVTVRLLHMQN
jgi:hypothetical protein